MTSDLVRLVLETGGGRDVIAEGGEAEELLAMLLPLLAEHLFWAQLGERDAHAHAWHQARSGYAHAPEQDDGSGS
jgi:hypothetical protein